MPEIALDAKARAVILLAAGRSTDDTGRELGINGRTVRRWREDPGFEAQIAEARRATLDEALGALTAAARAAVDVLRDALAEGSPVIRVRAALGLLQALPNITEFAQLEARVAELEARLAGEAAA